MTKDEALKIVMKHLAPCFNGNMQINDKAVEGIWNEFRMNPTCVEAMKKVVEWFNRHDLGLKPLEYQKRYIGATVNMITLLAMGDVAGLVNDWILKGME